MRCVGGILGDSSAVADISVQNVCETLFDPCQQVDWCAVSCISETDLGWSGGAIRGASATTAVGHKFCLALSHPAYRRGRGRHLMVAEEKLGTT